MISLHVRRIGAVLAAYLAVVAVQDADTLRKQRRDDQAAATGAARPSAIRDAAPRPTLATERGGSTTAGERPAPAVVRLDKLV